MGRKKYKPKPKKLMSESKRRKLIKWIESRTRQGLPKDKGRATSPATTKSHGRLMYTWKNGIKNVKGK